MSLPPRLLTAALLGAACIHGAAHTAGCALPGAAASAADPHLPPADLADQLLAELSELRRLQPRGEVSRRLHDEAQLRAYVQERLRREYPGDLLRREQELLAALRLLPSDCDLEKAVSDLYASQTYGYYDPERRALYLSDRLPAEAQRSTLIHELAHALQDQHFGIGRFLSPDRSRVGDDAQVAGMALLEGDATATMLAVQAKSAGAPGVQGRDWVDEVSGFSRRLAANRPAASSSLPEFLIDLLAFPYLHGTAFVAALYERGGWPAVDAAFRSPPASSEQILHPERYPGDAPENPPPTIFPERLAGMERVHQMVLGEFVTRRVLQPRLGEEAAARAASGWDGDRAALYEGESRRLLVWLSVWDEPAEAAEFAEALRRGPEDGSLVEARGTRVLHLGASGEVEAGFLLEAAAGLWKGWS
jgi:hypothetical protein